MTWLLEILAIHVIFCCFHHCRSVVYDTSLWTRERGEVLLVDEEVGPGGAHGLSLSLSRTSPANLRREHLITTSPSPWGVSFNGSACGKQQTITCMLNIILAAEKSEVYTKVCILLCVCVRCDPSSPATITHSNGKKVIWSVWCCLFHHHHRHIHNHSSNPQHQATPNLIPSQQYLKQIHYIQHSIILGYFFLLFLFVYLASIWLTYTQRLTAWLSGAALGLVPPCWPHAFLLTSCAHDDDGLRRPCHHRYQRSSMLPRSLYPLCSFFSSREKDLTQHKVFAVREFVRERCASALLATSNWGGSLRLWRLWCDRMMVYPLSLVFLSSLLAPPLVC